MLEVFNNLFMSIAEQMGRDAFQHRLLGEHQGAAGLLLRDLRSPPATWWPTRPHMPVHLGSMGESIKTVIRENAGSMKPGNVYAPETRPYNGGTHLPDVTVITPVFDDAGQEILFYVGSRGHHADIGGRTPGSAPPDSTVIEEEGRPSSTTFLMVEEGRAARGGDAGAAEVGQVSLPQPAAEHGRPRRPDRRQTRPACRRCARCSHTSASTWCRPTCATCRTTPRSRCAGCWTC